MDMEKREGTPRGGGEDSAGKGKRLRGKSKSKTCSLIKKKKKTFSAGNAERMEVDNVERTGGEKAGGKML